VYVLSYALLKTRLTAKWKASATKMLNGDQVMQITEVWWLSGLDLSLILKAKFHYAIQLASESARELVCDLLVVCWRPASELDSVMEFGLSRTIQLASRSLAGLRPACASWSQTWFPTCRRQVRAIWICRDSLNLAADRFHSWSATSSRAGSI